MYSSQSKWFKKYQMNSHYIKGICFIAILAVISACNPHDVHVELPESAPVQKITSYNQALTDLGLMTEIYGTGIVKIQSEDIVDNTGTSGSTGGEIQRNITEIMKSVLNTIGGNVVFIEYNPAYIQNQMVSGYSQFENKTIPDVVITGGITEFDRGLETRGDGTDASAEATVSGLPSAVPSSKLGFEYSDAGKSGKARITLDFNLKDFQTLAGIARMNTVNSIEVHKAVREKEIGITIFGPTFGMKGSIKKVQGRHEAVRLLVQASMIQMVGKYLVLPYWRLLGDDNQPDRIVNDLLSRSYARMTPTERIENVQQWLYLHGKNVDITSVIDPKTEAALRDFGSSGQIDRNTFIKIYTTIPINHDTLVRRESLNQLYAEASPAPQATEPTPVAVQASPPAPEAVAEAQPKQQEQVAPAASTSKARQSSASKPKQRTKGIGRMLKDDEW